MLINHLRRITRDGRWIPEVDGLRFVAIATVFVFHLTGELLVRSGRVIPFEPRFWWLQRIIGNGDRGVILFFVISGMILAMPFARHALLGTRPVSLRKYYLRRVTRLEPPYLLTILFASLLLLGYFHHLPPDFFGHVFATAFYQHSLTYGTMSTVNPVTWSLEVEIQFYVLAPLIMMLFRIPGKGVRRAALLLLIVGAGLAQQPFVESPRFIASVLYYVQYFLAGLFVADLFVLDLDRMRSTWLWDLAGVVSLAVLLWAPHDASWAHTVMPLFLITLFIAALRSILLRRFFAAPWIAVIGGMCYSIYLLHFLLIAVFFKLTRHAIIASATFPANLAIQLLVTGIPTLILCAVFFVAVERPCMDPDWPAHLWKRITGRTSPELEALDTKGISD